MFHKIKKIPGEFFATSFYVGLIKFAPGTFGSLVGLLASLFLINFFSFLFFVFCTVVVTIFGYFVTKIYLKAKNSEHEDPSEVVIDEVAGQMVSIAIFYFIWIIIFKKSYLHFDKDFLFLILFINFVCFRFFDILKIFPVSYFDKREGAFFVMADDIVAGILSGISSIALFLIFYFCVAIFTC